MRGRIGDAGVVVNPETCHWCGGRFTPRPDNKHGFCANLCRAKFHKAARIWVLREIDEGRVSVEELRVIL